MSVAARSSISGSLAADPETAAVILKHVDAGAAVRRVDHHVQGAVRRQHLAQRAQPGVGIGQVVQHAGADDVVETLAEFAGAFDGELSNLEIVELVFALELQLVRDAVFADVDSDDACPRPADGVVRGLRRAAAGDENAAIVAIGLVRPEEMRVGAPAIAVPGAPVGIEIVDRRRVGVTLVEVTHPSHDHGVFLEPRGVYPCGFCACAITESRLNDAGF